MKHDKFIKTLFLVLLLMIPLGSNADMFGQGGKRFSLLLGRGQAFGDNYTILGLGFGYYVYDGLELAINWDSWQGGDPNINQVTPEVRYVFRTRSSIDPYVGALYRWTSVSGFDDETAYGFRAGVYIKSGPRSYIGIGAAYVETINCDEQVYVSCSDTYPEFSFAFLL
jgi:hypothetical protein